MATCAECKHFDFVIHPDALGDGMCAVRLDPLCDEEGNVQDFEHLAVTADQAACKEGFKPRKEAQDDRATG